MILQRPEPPAPTHYEVDGRKYVRVTTVLNCLHKPGIEAWWRKHGFEHCDGVSAEARAFGTRLHKALEMASRPVPGGPWERPEEYRDVMPYIDAYMDWATSRTAVFMDCERRVVSSHGYAGTLDCLLDIEGEACLIDFKTGDFERPWPEHLLQTAAYRLALAEEGVIARRRIILQFSKKEPGRLVPHELANHRADTEAWLHLLEVWKWTEARGR